jgi:spermidine synthase
MASNEKRSDELLSSVDLINSVSQGKEIHRIETQYNGHDIRIVEDEDFRYLLFGSDCKTRYNSIQGGINLSSHREPVLPYYEASIDVIGDMPSSAKALCIGLGAGFIPKEVRLRTGCNVEVVEVDKDIYKIACEYFYLPDDIIVHICDGFNFVMKSTEKYDFINIDAYRGNQIPFQMVTREFFEKCNALLTEEGVFSINLCSTHPFYYSHLNTIMSVFGEELYVNERAGNVIVYNLRKHEIMDENMCFTTRKIKKNKDIEKSQIFNLDSV